METRREKLKSRKGVTKQTRDRQHKGHTRIKTENMEQEKREDAK